MGAYELLTHVDRGHLADCYEGLINVREHPTADLFIACYSNEVIYSQAWDAYTTACRGLIFDSDGVVVARPFPKFFNLFEVELPESALTEDPLVFDKVDGSLGIGYEVDGRLAVSTKGSFESDQAVWATEYLQSEYPNWRPPAGVTPLWEIIHPAFRIVVDYGPQRGLTLLGGVEIATGREVPVEEMGWPGAVVDLLEGLGSIDEIQSDVLGGNFDDVEGVIAAWPQADGTLFRVKVKSPEYIRLHRIRTNLSLRMVCEAWEEDRPLSENPDLTEEDRHWAGAVEQVLQDEFDHIFDVAGQCYADLSSLLPDRAKFADAAKDYDYSNLLFAQIDGRDIAPMIQRMLSKDSGLRERLEALR